MSIIIGANKITQVICNGIKCREVICNGLPVHTADCVVVGDDAQPSDVTNKINWYGSGTINVSTEQLQLIGGGGQVTNTATCNVALPKGFTNLTININVSSDSSGYYGAVKIGTTKGGSDLLDKGTGTYTVAIDPEQEYFISLTCYHTYSRNVSVVVDSLVLT